MYRPIHFLFVHFPLLILVKLLAIFHVSAHTKQVLETTFPCCCLCFAFREKDQFINVLFGRREKKNMMLLFEEGKLSYETRGLSLMHRDNNVANIERRCTQNMRKIEKFIFNGHKASLCLFPGLLLSLSLTLSCPMKTSGVCIEITSIAPSLFATAVYTLRN